MNKFDSIETRLSRLDTFVNRESLRTELTEQEKVRLELSADNKKESNEILLKVMELFKGLGGDHEAELLTKLEKFVNYGLTSVFGDRNNFKTILSTEGKDLRVDFYVDVNGIPCDVTNAKGGGVAEVVSLLLQLFFVVASGEKTSPILILDTAMVHLSDHYHRNMSALMKELAHQLNLQIILMAHSGEFGDFADILYNFSQVDGKTIARRVK